MTVSVESTQYTTTRLLRADVRPEGGSIFKCEVKLPDGFKIKDPERCFILCTPRLMRDEDPSDPRDYKRTRFSAALTVHKVTRDSILVWCRRTDEMNWDDQPELALSILIAE